MAWCLIKHGISFTLSLPFREDTVKAATFQSQHLKGTDQFGAVAADGRIILKCMLTLAVNRCTGCTTVIFLPPIL
jgi:hypothetical protein